MKRIGHFLDSCLGCSLVTFVGRISLGRVESHYHCVEPGCAALSSKVGPRGRVCREYRGKWNSESTVRLTIS